MIGRGASFCRTCGSEQTALVLPLGEHPLANAFLSREQLAQPEPRFALDLTVCERCALLQIPNQVLPAFFRHYLYVPSASEEGARHFASLGRLLLDRYAPRGRAASVVDIGCNDGIFLGACAQLGARTLGIDPASNLAPLARRRGVEVIEDYFSPAVAEEALARRGPADSIVTTNTLNHVDDLRAFVAGVVALLAPDGVFVVEVPAAADLLAGNEFDTVYHEHLSQFSLRSLRELFAPFDLAITAVERLGIHGGSMRVTAGRARTASPSVNEWLAGEQRAGLFSGGTYRQFRAHVEENRERLVELLAGLARSGARLAGYGAPAKGNTLLNYCGIGPDRLEFLADRNPLKHGLCSPGMHIPVAPAEHIEARRPDYLLVLAWNFLDEIVAQQRAHTARGGKFVVPIPTPRILG